MADFLSDPTSAGAMSLGLRLLSTPGKFGQALGTAGLGAMNDMQRARVLQAAEKDRALQAQIMQMQVAQMVEKQKQAAEAQKRQQSIEGAYRGALEMPAQQALAMGGGPTVANAQAMQGMAPRINQQRLIESLSQVDPIAAAQMLTPKPDETKVVGDALLGIGPGGVKELYRAPQKPEKVDPNKPFLFVDGKIVPNPAYQEYAKQVAAAGASKVNVGAPVFETEFSKASGKKFAEVYDTINSDGMSANQQLANITRMEQLLQGVDGGKLAPAGKEIASIAQSFGIALDPKLGNKEAAESLSREMALSMRKPGTGPMTDKDFENFMLIVPSLSKSAEGRAEITATMRAKAKRDAELADLAQRYVQQKGILDTGFYAVAQQFIAQNPVVQKQPAGNVRERADAILKGGK